STNRSGCIRLLPPPVSPAVPYSSIFGISEAHRRCVIYARRGFKRCIERCAAPHRRRRLWISRRRMGSLIWAASRSTIATNSASGRRKPCAARAVGNDRTGPVCAFPRISQPTLISDRRRGGLAQADWRLLRCLVLHRGGAPAQYRLARSGGLVEPPAWGQARRGMECRRLACLGPRGQSVKDSGELIERGLAFGLGRLDQQRAVHDQREVHRHRVKALVDQRLREIERDDPGILQEIIVEQHLMHANAWEC